MGEPAIYDSIVDEYSQAKSNPYKRFVEEPTIWKHCLNDLAGKTVLDMACGSGHYSRQMRQRGAQLVVGVDVSSEMIEEAKRLGTDSCLLYVAAEATDRSAYMPLIRGDAFDVVTAQYLFPYASCVEELRGMCEAAFQSLKPGGSFAGVTSWLGKELKSSSREMCYSMSWEAKDQGAPLHDGVRVQLTVLDAEGRDAVSFPNHLWTQETLSAALLAAGFADVEWHQEVCDDTSADAQAWLETARQDFGLCGYFVARKSKEDVALPPEALRA